VSHATNGVVPVLEGRAVSGGVARARAVVTSEPFMFSHGLDPAAGVVVDRDHELYGCSIKGSAFVFPYGVGSTSAGMWLLETIRRGNAPAALVLEEIDAVLATGAIFAELFFGHRLPIVDKTQPSPVSQFRTGDVLEVDGTSGLVRLLERSGGHPDGSVATGVSRRGRAD